MPNPTTPQRDSQKTAQNWFTLGHLVALALIVWVFYSLFTAPRTISKQVSWTEFMDELRDGRLSEVNVGSQTLTGKLKPEPKPAAPPEQKGSNGKKPVPQQASQPAQIVATRLPGVDNHDLLAQLEAQHVKVYGQFRDSSIWVDVIASWIFPLLILFAIYYFAMRRMKQAGGNFMAFGKNKAKIHDESSKIDVTFRDVAGVDEAKAELEEIIDFLQRPGKYQKLGGRIPRGVLLVGPPGTGKTLLAKAVAGEAGVAFFSLSGSEFVEMFVGVGAARVRDLFEQARRNAPCIVFIDELDAIGKSRSAGRNLGFTNDEREQTLNQLLAEMDGFDSSLGVILMGATNTPEVLDPALLRPGRFDRQVMVDRPDLKDRVAILNVHARKVVMSDNVNLDAIAARTPGMVGADLANIINEAALLAVRRNSDQVEMRDLEEAVDRVMLGLEKKNRVMSPEEKERVAVHESGHALVALSVPHADPLHRISIIPRSIGALGYTLQLPTQERYLMTREQLEDQIAVLLGGRAAEEIQYGVVSTGAADDLERASELVRQMVMQFGMSDRVGKLTWGRSQRSKFLKTPFDVDERNYSDETAEAIDEELRRMIDEIYGRVREILERNRGPMARISNALIHKETLDREELDKLLEAPEAAPQAEEKTPVAAR